MIADLPSALWGGWIVVITIVSLGGFVWLVYGIYFSKDVSNHASPVWDETLTEGDEPAPMWWFWMTFTALICTVIYLLLFPGLGTFKGVLDWSQGGRLQQSQERYEERFGALRQKLAATPVEELVHDELAMASAGRAFDRACGICHGQDGRGQADRFPNLVDDDWQWGGSAAQIEQTIRNGRIAVMPGWQAALGDDGVAEVVAYVRALAAGDESRTALPGHARYQVFCIACHGPTGQGNPMLGAPNLTDDAWLYGNSDEALATSIAIGRNGHMPAFGERLDDTQIRLLVAWLLKGGGTGQAAN
jgi:cytochrome c oxidase cbb3-type subunit III